MPTLTATRLRSLETAARQAAKASYSPYSGFAVGAALLTGSGKIFSGTNVENASFGLTQCAERTALCTAVAAGERELLAVAIYTPTPDPVTPCGACRQVLNEFGPHARIICLCDGPDRLDLSLDSLLPGAFGPANLA